MNLDTKITVAQLKRAIDVREKIESLEVELAQILGGKVPMPRAPIKRGRKKMSAAGRAKIAAAQKARWSKVKGKKTKPKRMMSAKARAAISAAAKARWKRAKAAGKTTL